MESPRGQKVLRIELTLHSLHQLSCRSKAAPGIEFVLDLGRRLFDDQTTAQSFRLLTQLFKRADGPAMIHRNSRDRPQSPVTQSSVPLKLNVRCGVLCQRRNVSQERVEIR